MTKWISTGVVLCAGCCWRVLHCRRIIPSRACIRWARKPRSLERSRHFVLSTHSSLKVEVKGQDGSIVEWSFLGGSVSSLRGSIGKTGPNALKAGDEITVTCVPRARLACCQRSHTRTATIRFRSPDE